MRLVRLFTPRAAEVWKALRHRRVSTAGKIFEVDGASEHSREVWLRWTRSRTGHRHAPLIIFLTRDRVSLTSEPIATVDSMYLFQRTLYFVDEAFQDSKLAGMFRQGVKPFYYLPTEPVTLLGLRYLTLQQRQSGC